MLERRYSCKACGEVAARSRLRTGAWGDRCCPRCGSPDIERHRTRFQRWYSIFFLYKVY